MRLYMQIFRQTLAALLFLTVSLAYGQSIPIVAAASDLKFVLEEIAANYKAETGKEVKLIFGSSGVLWQQSKNGAPFGLLMSADEAYIDDLHKNGLTVDAGQLYGIGRIVLLSKRKSSINLDSDKATVLSAITAAKKIAIANPDHAPYGKAAKEYLIRLGVWEQALPKLVYGENITHATMFALSGSVDFCISAYSLALAPKIQSQSSYALIPAELHQPLRQKMVLLKNKAPSARDFYQYLQESKSKQALRQYGFVLP